MSILPTVGVQQSIEQIPVLIQSSPPLLPFFPSVAAFPLAISEVEKVREIHPVSRSRENAVGSNKKDEDDTARKEKEDEDDPDNAYPRSKGHLDLRV